MTQRAHTRNGNQNVRDDEKDYISGTFWSKKHRSHQSHVSSNERGPLLKPTTTTNIPRRSRSPSSNVNAEKGYDDEKR